MASAKMASTLYQKVGRQIDGLVQERRNSIANALELCVSCTNSLRYVLKNVKKQMEVMWAL